METSAINTFFCNVVSLFVRHGEGECRGGFLDRFVLQVKYENSCISYLIDTEKYIGAIVI